MEAMGRIVFALALLAAPIATADDLPQQSPPLPPCCGAGSTPPILNHQTYSSPAAVAPRPGGRVRMECIRKWEMSGRGRFQTQTARLSDDEKKAGYVVTGGGCEQVFPEGNFAFIASRPLGDDGWFCMTGDLPGLHGAGYQIQASLVGCRIAVDYDPLEAAAPVTTIDGHRIPVARRGTGFAKALQRDYRVCNTDVAPIGVQWSDGAHTDPLQPPNTDSLAPGQCMEFGGSGKARATAIHISASTLSHRQTAYFARYARGTFASGVAKNFVPVPASPPPSHPADAKSMDVVCKPASGAPNGVAGDTVFVRECPLPIPTWGRYRVCFDDTYVVQQDGRVTTWPPTALPMVLDRNLIKQVDPSNSEDPRRSRTFPNVCRDLYNVQTASFFVGRQVGDANFAPGAIYDPDHVRAVRLWIAPLK